MEHLKLGGGEEGTQPVTCEAVRAVTTTWLQPKDSDSSQHSSYLSTGLKEQWLNFNQGAEGKRTDGQRKGQRKRICFPILETS